MLWSVLLLAAGASAHVKSSLPSVPSGWKKVRAASADESVSLKIALPAHQSDALEAAILRVSTPNHPQYGMHLSSDEVRSLIAPSDETTDAVTEWLNRNGIKGKVDNDWVSFTTSVAKANNLLNTTFAWYQQDGDKTGPKLRTLQYSVPDELDVHVDMIQPTTRFGKLAAKASTIFEIYEEPETQGVANVKVAADEGHPTCTGCIYPDQIRSLYNIKYKPSASEKNTVAFASYLEQYSNYADFTSFAKAFVPEAADRNYTVQLVKGGLHDQSPDKIGVEANLDLQYILAVSNPIPIREYSTGGRGPLVPDANQPGPEISNEPYLDFFQYLLSLSNSELPQTLSTSYGEEEQSVPREYAEKVCSMIGQLGARGVSVIFSSGDSGPGNACIRNDGTNSTYFEPTFPGACPWVTAVGGTYQTAPEKAVYFSSGGFSMYHKRPMYQDLAVKKYLSKIGNTYSKFFDNQGRGFPDVSAQAYKYAVYIGGRLAGVSGTSASAPAFAGVVALLNAARKSRGLPSLGFINPLLYAAPSAFTDIVDGAGTGCQGRPEFAADEGGSAKWNATEGWDPVTGLGTPKFDKLLALAAPGVKNA
ncbi:peptidase S8/S53 domain-containing protein [Neurospora tetraspora]|uniref:tripeptidyl-peptidase II n=1 Tax=Neurospora tetraspora TaxID=94610 RepID=A0AAE0JGJ7_9PEZI|nr:peptidase S8/S53 domain-containing protein [Neurospora tetraspora]